MPGFPMTDPQKRRLEEILRQILKKSDTFVTKGLPNRDPFRGTLFNSLYEGYGVIKTGEYVLDGLLSNPQVVSEKMDLEPLYKTLVGHALICALLATDVLGVIEKRKKDEKKSLSPDHALKVLEDVGLAEKPKEIN